jgi:ribosomal protein S3
LLTEWRFTHGYLKKTGEPAKVVDRALSQGTTQQGVVGVQVSILRPDAPLHDQINVDDNMLQKIRVTCEELDNPVEEEKPVKKKTTKKKSTKKEAKK